MVDARWDERPLEHILLERLGAGPWTPTTELSQGGSEGPFGALDRLERLGLARMAGSHAGGPWILTDAGRERLKLDGSG